MEIANLLGADAFVPPLSRIAPDPRLPAAMPMPAPTLDQLRRRPRPPLAWEAAQCARNFGLLRAPLAAAPIETAPGRWRRPDGWTTQGL